jgi:MoxR-like ATPase
MLTTDVQSIAKVVQEHSKAIQTLIAAVERVIVGQRTMIDRLMIGLLCNGHVLLEGVPGLAKTLTVSTLARAIHAKFARIQFTPDLLPADLVGTLIYNPREGVFTPRKGPIFANIVLADEINRAPAKVQSALLEAMQERQVTIGDETYPLPSPFLVLATQNPIEQEGTYPLPEAQLDRFMFQIDINYPSVQEEEEIYSFASEPRAADPKPVLTAKNVLDIQAAMQQVAVSKYVVSYVARVVRSTRPADAQAPAFVKKTVEWGAGPRAGLYLIQGARAVAAMDGRPYVSCDDVRRVSIPVMKHRISTNFQAQMEGIDSVKIVQKLLQTIEEPKVPKYQEPSAPQMPATIQE